MLYIDLFLSRCPDMTYLVCLGSGKSTAPHPRLLLREVNSAESAGSLLKKESSITVKFLRRVYYYSQASPGNQNSRESVEVQLGQQCIHSRKSSCVKSRQRKLMSGSGLQYLLRCRFALPPDLCHLAPLCDDPTVSHMETTFAQPARVIDLIGHNIIIPAY